MMSMILIPPSNNTTLQLHYLGNRGRKRKLGTQSGLNFGWTNAANCALSSAITSPKRVNLCLSSMHKPEAHIATALAQWLSFSRLGAAVHLVH